MSRSPRVSSRIASTTSQTMTNVATRSLARLDDYCRNDTERLGYCCTSDFARSL